MGGSSFRTINDGRGKRCDAGEREKERINILWKSDYLDLFTSSTKSTHPRGAKKCIAQFPLSFTSGRARKRHMLETS